MEKHSSKRVRLLDENRVHLCVGDSFAVHFPIFQSLKTGSNKCHSFISLMSYQAKDLPVVKVFNSLHGMN